MLSRRRFIQASMGTMAFLAMRRRAFAYNQSPTLSKFPPGWNLQGLGPNGIPVASPDATGITYGSTKVTHYTIDAKAYTQVLHPDLPATPLWGYGQNGNHRHLGGVIVVNKNQPIQVRVNNLLSGDHPVKRYIDRSEQFQDCFDYPDNRIAVHLHGGFIPWISDGGPDGWFGPAGGWAGHNYASLPTTMVGNGVKAQQNSVGYSEYYWGNQQSARLMWYHDHSHDQTRLSAYGGLASAYIVRDDLENLLIRSGVIPSREVPLVFQDKVFNSGNDSSGAARGSLWYPSIYQPDLTPDGRWEVGSNPAPTKSPLPIPSVVPEFYGDTILCNGTAYPNVAVAPRRYRFRILNAFQAKFLNVNFVVLPSGVVEVPVVTNDQPPYDFAVAPPAVITHKIPDPALNALKIIQIGTEGGLLKAPVVFNATGKVVPVGFSSLTGNITRYGLVLGPGERCDILVDFKGLPQDTKVVMYTDAPSPFPSGDPRNDYFVGMQDFTEVGGNEYGLAGGAKSGLEGYGPDTRSLVRFTVGSGTGLANDLPEATILAALTQQMRAAFTTLSPASATGTTDLTLNEDFDEYGRLTQKLGTVITGTSGNLNKANPLFYYDALTEEEVYDNHETRMWRIWNLTADTHPIHVHLVGVQVVKRELFDGHIPNPDATSPLIAAYPDPANPTSGVDRNELGWKETVRINPFEVVTVIMKFDLPVLPFTMPLSTNHAIQTGHEYVWHCHILEHEEHDMMRSFIVKP